MSRYTDLKCPKCGSEIELRGYGESATRIRDDLKVYDNREKGWLAFARCLKEHTSECDFREEIFIGVI